jgi:hypothetical protein
MEDGNGHMWPHYYIRGETATSLPVRRHAPTQAVAVPVKKEDITRHMSYPKVLDDP